MAKQFTDQPLLTTADATDIVPIRDISAGVDKKTTVGGLATAVAAYLPDGSVSYLKMASPHKFRVRRNAALNFVRSSATKVAWDTETYDTGSNFNTTTNRFVAPVTGLYQFSARVLLNTSTSPDFEIALYKNGTIYSAGSRLTCNFPGLVITDEIQLSATDYVEVFIANNTPGTDPFMDVSTPQNYFTGHLVSVA